MNKLMIINDIHLLAKRSSGTTPASSKALTEWVFARFEDLLNLADRHDLLINGDLFDSAHPAPFGLRQPENDLVLNAQTHIVKILANWCRRNPEHTLYLAAGNHDLPRNDGLPSAFGTLCDTLQMLCRNTVRINGAVLRQPEKGFCVVPHFANQTLFDEALNDALDSGCPYVFVHANYDNYFAVQSDHSLNISADVARQFKQNGQTLVFAHEHHGRDLGHVKIIGNQIPTSIADCLDGNPTKRYAVLDYAQKSLTFHDFLDIDAVYAQVAWQDETLPEKPFIRVTGHAQYGQAAAVVKQIAAWRSQSSAFVIGNAVQTGAGDIQLAAADVQDQAFDIWEEIMRHIPDNLKQFAQEVRHHA